MLFRSCRELFAAAMRGVDDLVYNLEGDRLLLTGEEVTAESSSSKGDNRHIGGLKKSQEGKYNQIQWDPRENGKWLYQLPTYI